MPFHYSYWPAPR